MRWSGKANPQCRFTQLDWANVNRIARRHQEAGIADRFETIDDDFHTADFGSALATSRSLEHRSSGVAPRKRRCLRKSGL
jgi:hypothetical protein